MGSKTLLSVILILVGLMACRKEMNDGFRHYPSNKKIKEIEPQSSIKSQVQLNIKEDNPQSKYAFIYGYLYTRDSTRLWFKERSRMLLWTNEKSKIFVSQNPIFSRNILVIDNKNNQRFNITSGIDGHFRLAILPTTFDFQFEHSGYNPLTIKNLSVNSGETIDLSIILGTADSIAGPKNYVYKVTDDRKIVEVKSIND